MQRSKYIRAVSAAVSEQKGRYSLTVTSESGAREYRDLTRDGEGIRELCERINRGRVSAIHVEDIIEDFLG